MKERGNILKKIMDTCYNIKRKKDDYALCTIRRIQSSYSLNQRRL